MSRKVYEIAFQINGKMARNFSGAFDGASSKVQRLRNDLQTLNTQYKKGALSAKDFESQHHRLTEQLEEEKDRIDKARRAQERYNDVMRKQMDMARNTRSIMGSSIRNTLTYGAGAAAIGGGIFLGSSLKKAMDYEAQMSSIQANAGLTNAELAEMNALSLEMGAQTKYSALQAAQAIEELLKSGMAPATIQAGGLENALNLATAGGLELADAAVIMSDSLNGYRKDAMTATDAANLLTGAARASSTDVAKIYEGLAQVGPVADGLGVSFKATNAVLAAFSNNMLKGSDAGTSFKTFLQNVQPDTKKSMALFKQYGLITADGTNTLFDANGQLKDMADVAEILKRNLGKLNDQQRSSAFFEMFGTDAVRAANILFKEGAEGIEKMYDEMAKVTALDIAKKKMDNAAGAVEQFRGAIETLQISALQPTLPLIKDLALGAADFAEKYGPRITSAVENAVDTAASYLQSEFVNNPEFQSMPDIRSKIKFVFNSLNEDFNEWYDASGRKKMEDLAEEVTSTLGKGLAASDEIAIAAVKIGGSIASGVIKGLRNTISEDPVAAAVVGGIAGAAVGGPVGAVLGAGGAVGQHYTDKATDWIMSTGILQSVADKGQQLINSIPDEALAKKINYEDVETFFTFGMNKVLPEPDGSHKDGLSYVPYDGYTPELHRGERVLTAGENRGYSLWERASGAYKNREQPIQVTFAPVINGVGEEIIPALQAQQNTFVKQLSGVIHQQRRVAYD